MRFFSHCPCKIRRFHWTSAWVSSLCSLRLLLCDFGVLLPYKLFWRCHLKPFVLIIREPWQVEQAINPVASLGATEHYLNYLHAGVDVCLHFLDCNNRRQVTLIADRYNSAVLVYRFYKEHPVVNVLLPLVISD